MRFVALPAAVNTGAMAGHSRSAPDIKHQQKNPPTALSFLLGLPLTVAYLFMSIRGTIERFRGKQVKVIVPESSEMAEAKDATLRRPC